MACPQGGQGYIRPQWSRSVPPARRPETCYGRWGAQWLGLGVGLGWVFFCVVSDYGAAFDSVLSFTNLPVLSHFSRLMDE